MVWINVKNELPKAFEVVWIYWKDRQVLLACRTYEPFEYEPSEGWYSFEDDKCKWAHWWQRVDSYNIDKPNRPD